MSAFERSGALPHHSAAIVADLVAAGVPQDVARDCAGNYLTACMHAAMGACDRRGIDAWEIVWRAADRALAADDVSSDRAIREAEAREDWPEVERLLRLKADRAAVRLQGDGFTVARESRSPRGF